MCNFQSILDMFVTFMAQMTKMVFLQWIFFRILAHCAQVLLLRTKALSAASLCLTATEEMTIKLSQCQQFSKSQQWIFSNFKKEGLTYSDLHYD